VSEGDGERVPRLLGELAAPVDEEREAELVGVAAVGEGLAGDAIGEGAGGGVLVEGGDHSVIEEGHVAGQAAEGIPEGGGGPGDVLDEAVGAALEGLGDMEADE